VPSYYDPAPHRITTVGAPEWRCTCRASATNDVCFPSCFFATKDEERERPSGSTTTPPGFVPGLTLGAQVSPRGRGRPEALALSGHRPQAVRVFEAGLYQRGFPAVQQPNVTPAERYPRTADQLGAALVPTGCWRRRSAESPVGPPTIDIRVCRRERREARARWEGFESAGPSTRFQRNRSLGPDSRAWELRPDRGNPSIRRSSATPSGCASRRVSARDSADAQPQRRRGLAPDPSCPPPLTARPIGGCLPPARPEFSIGEPGDQCRLQPTRHRRRGPAVRAEPRKVPRAVQASDVTTPDRSPPDHAPTWMASLNRHGPTGTTVSAPSCSRRFFLGGRVGPPGSALVNSHFDPRRFAGRRRRCSTFGQPQTSF